jgi:upstream activation factor subunit UAF30
LDYLLLQIQVIIQNTTFGKMADINGTKVVTMLNMLLHQNDQLSFAAAKSELMKQFGSEVILHFNKELYESYEMWHSLSNIKVETKHTVIIDGEELDEIFEDGRDNHPSSSSSSVLKKERQQIPMMLSPQMASFVGILSSSKSKVQEYVMTYIVEKKLEKKVKGKKMYELDKTLSQLFAQTLQNIKSEPNSLASSSSSSSSSAAAAVESKTASEIPKMLDFNELRVAINAHLTASNDMDGTKKRKRDEANAIKKEKAAAAKAQDAIDNPKPPKVPKPKAAPTVTDPNKKPPKRRKKEQQSSSSIDGKAKLNPNSGLNQIQILSEPLATLLNIKKGPRGEVTKLVWDYIKANNLQHENNGRVILLKSHSEFKLLFCDKIQEIHESVNTTFHNFTANANENANTEDLINDEKYQKAKKKYDNQQKNLSLSGIDGDITAYMEMFELTTALSLHMTKSTDPADQIVVNKDEDQDEDQHQDQDQDQDQKEDMDTETAETSGTCVKEENKSEVIAPQAQTEETVPAASAPRSSGDGAGGRVCVDDGMSMLVHDGGADSGDRDSDGEWQY